MIVMPPQPTNNYDRGMTVVPPDPNPNIVWSKTIIAPAAAVDSGIILDTRKRVLRIANPKTGELINKADYESAQYSENKTDNENEQYSENKVDYESAQYSENNVDYESMQYSEISTIDCDSIQQHNAEQSKNDDFDMKSLEVISICDQSISDDQVKSSNTFVESSISTVLSNVDKGLD
jgi:hypothetical protein